MAKKPVPALPAAGPAEGEAAPAFELPASGGAAISLKSLKGKIAVLFFYPKDDTSGCTQEALNFTENAEAFTDLGAALVGISRDSVQSHDKFIAKHGLKVTLASDTDGSVCESYGVWVEKSMYGRKYMGIERSTFLINQKGKIVKVWRKVKVAGHANEVLAAVREISG